LLLADLDRPRQATARRALGLALRRAGRSTVHLRPFGGRLDPEIVGLVLGRVDRVVAASPANAADLVSAGLVRVEVGSRSDMEPAAAAEGSHPPEMDAGGPLEPGGGRRQPWSLEPGSGRQALEDEVRRRAAADRSSERRGVAPAPVVAGPLRHLLPLTPVPTLSRRPIFGVVKRAVRRLVAWQIDPVIDHVNLLHRAAIDAVEARETEPDRPGSASTAGGPGSASTAGGPDGVSS
jgi:hypothetical protein